MNERIREIAEQVYGSAHYDDFKFAELIVAQNRPWVGLTDEEIKEIIGPWGDTPIKGYTRKLFDQIETKLREKNGG
jgi:hypothetical protein